MRNHVIEIKADDKRNPAVWARGVLKGGAFLNIDVI